jgi:hypothetical protein
VSPAERDSVARDCARVAAVILALIRGAAGQTTNQSASALINFITISRIVRNVEAGA